MRCLRCGNEVHPEEVFCGQCGAPSTSPLSPVNNAPQSQSGPMPRIYQANAPFSPLQSREIVASTQSSSSKPYTSQITPPLPHQSNVEIHPPNQQSGFYHGTIEAVSFPSNSIMQSHPGTHSQSNTTSPSAHFSYPRNSQFTGFQYAQPAKQQQEMKHNPTAKQVRPAQKQPHSTIVLTICIGLVIALLSVIGLLAFNLSKGHMIYTPNTTNTAPIATTGPAEAATSTIEPTGIATRVPTTIIADTGFTLCQIACTPYSFSAEYPTGWTQRTLTTTAGTQFMNPNQTDAFASFEAPTLVSSSTTAGGLLNSDITAHFSNKPGYIAPTTNQTATVSGETWTTTIIYYQGETQKERVEIYTTVHNSKAYIIELQAPDTLFDSINSAYYTTMMSKYQFLQSGTA